MNITIVNSQISDKIRLLNRIIQAKTPLPILTHILFRAEPMDDRLYLAATDLEVGLSTSCKATVHEPGTLALPAKTMLQLVDQLMLNAEISIVQDKRQVLINSGSFKSRVQTLSPEDFPSLPERTGERAVLNGNGFRSLITHTQYAISDKPGKYIVDGSLLNLVGAENTAIMIAVDGKRLALDTIPYTGPDGQVIIPNKTLNILVSTEGEPEIEFSASQNHLFFAFGDNLLTSRVVDGKFPAYGKMIPQNNDNQVSIHRSALASALRRVFIMAGENQIVYLEFEAGQLTIRSQTTEGNADEQMAIAYEGPDMKLCLNGKFVLDFLNASQEERIDLLFKNAETPLMLRSGTTGFINVVMLIRP